MSYKVDTPTAFPIWMGEKPRVEAPWLHREDEFIKKSIQKGVCINKIAYYCGRTKREIISRLYKIDPIFKDYADSLPCSVDPFLDLSCMYKLYERSPCRMSASAANTICNERLTNIGFFLLGMLFSSLLIFILLEILK